ncbi:MAG: hemerythrin domain-containing protein [Thermoguttaceae bacterium]
MKPTEILSSEHRVIEQVLKSLTKMVDQAEAAGRLDREPAQDAVTFFRMFADRCHHGKEEVHLFPAMEAKGFSPDCGPTAVMRYEHEQGRTHIAAMDAAIDAAATGDRQALEQFSQHARAYVAMLEEHIRKEDHCLFAMADQAFSEQDQTALLAKFHKVEAEEMGEGAHDKYLQIANALADRYGVARVVTAGACCTCGH